MHEFFVIHIENKKINVRMKVDYGGTHEKTFNFSFVTNGFSNASYS